MNRGELSTIDELNQMMKLLDEKTNEKLLNEGGSCEHAQQENLLAFVY